ncbi:hypothetical protein EGW08_002006 [Elysia chlorotica]|uniref:Bile salt export pump n=1 Tax=Elysia chlorotica TaxID=188477 RepID=A0A433U8Q8_ELYCH|nr:hypothetical protein EGW08_002006 [Elysia chlorotica]
MTTLERDSYSKAGTIAEEVFSSIRTVHAFGGEQKEVERYVSNLADAKRYGINKSLVLGIGWGVSWCAIYINWGVGFWYGGKLVRDDDYSVKDMMSVFLQALLGVLALGLAAPSAITINTGRAAAYAVFQILDRKSEIDSLSPHGLKPATLTGNIRMKGVHFCYPCRQNVKVLQGLDLDIKAGQTVALVGASGCGKSTAIQMLLRFYDPDQGQVCLDGVDIRDINIRWLRQNIGLVGQEPVLFATTIAENIRYGCEGVTDAEILNACKNANAYDFIMKMPDKLETHVGERGAQLSGGQKQRIAIARALVKNPKVLLLDEATSALDTESEVLVQDALQKASQGRTTVIIAHRLSTVRNADLIVALDKGKVVEYGTHDELMARKGLYFNLVSLQLREADKEDNSIDIFKEKEERKTNPDDVSAIYKSQYTQEDERKRGAEDEEEDVGYPHINNPVWRLIWRTDQSGLSSSSAFSDEDKSEQKDKVNEMALMVGGLGFVSLFAFFFQEYMFGLSGEALTLRMRRKMFKAILRQNIAWFDDPRHETGVLSSRLATETSVVQGALKTMASSVLISVGNLGTGLVISFVFGWQLALVLMVFVPVIILSGIITMRVMGGAYNEGKAVMEEVSKGAVATIDNIRTVAALAKEEAFAQVFSDRMWAPHKVNVKKAVSACAAFGVTQGMYYVTFAVCFWYGAELLKDDDIDYYDIFKVFGCIILSAMHLGRVVAFAPDANSAIKSARRIFALHEYIPPIDAYSEAGEKPDKGTFTFSGAHFRYPMRPDAKVLDGLHLTVEPGQTLALVGESGCGKSTTMQLIERFYEAEAGSIYLDRYELKSLNVQWLRSQIGLVSQEPILFDLSIAENIAYGDNTREVPMSEIIQAAKSANIHNFIVNLPDAYNTSVGKKGTQLSGGQKQRIAIARALVRNPKILLLDEATSALDTESEKIVQEALDKARAGRTCITIAHRLSTIKDADKIAVFKAGVVHESGTHEELMARNGLYYMLQMAQSRK